MDNTNLQKWQGVGNLTQFSNFEGSLLCLFKSGLQIWYTADTQVHPSPSQWMDKILKYPPKGVWSRLRRVTQTPLLWVIVINILFILSYSYGIVFYKSLLPTFI